MSRIGKIPVEIPSGVTVEVKDDIVNVSGSKGNLSQPIVEGIKVEVADNKIIVSKLNEERKSRGNFGLMRTLIDNMVTGVTKGFEKKLILEGVGYRVSASGNDLRMSLGLSHEVIFNLPQGITASVDQNNITISGIDKQKVGQVAAEVRALKKPEPYKGKGIRYEDERILRKSGKSGKEGA